MRFLAFLAAKNTICTFKLKNVKKPAFQNFPKIIGFSTRNEQNCRES
tara:strand:+ start:387 stop:527 length:141 start_codon:yes stop_codon:yes gene_type:complete